MNQRLQGTLISLAIMFVFIALAVRRRMRPQPVRPNRILAFSALIVLQVLLASQYRLRGNCTGMTHHDLLIGNDSSAANVFKRYTNFGSRLHSLKDSFA